VIVRVYDGRHDVVVDLLDRIAEKSWGTDLHIRLIVKLVEEVHEDANG
jgi:hypothetical protein